MDNIFEYEDGCGHEWGQAERLAEEAFDLYEKGQMRQAFEKLTQAVEMGPENGAWFFNMALTMLTSVACLITWDLRTPTYPNIRLRQIIITKQNLSLLPTMDLTMRESV